MTDKPLLQVLIVAPSVQLGEGAEQYFREAGFLIVRGRPRDYKVLDATPPASSNAMLRAYLRAVARRVAPANGIGELIVTELAKEFAPDPVE